MEGGGERDRFMVGWETPNREMYSSHYSLTPTTYLACLLPNMQELLSEQLICQYVHCRGWFGPSAARKLTEVRICCIFGKTFQAKGSLSANGQIYTSI